MSPEHLQEVARGALEELKAIDIRSLDVRELTTVTDYMLLATGTSGRHVRALADEVAEQVRTQGGRPLGTEGLDSAEWVLIDLGDVLVHIMQREAREFYDLEKLWGESAPQGGG